MPIEIKGLDAVSAKLSTLEHLLGNSQLRVKLSTIGNMVKNTIEESFEEEKSPFGEKWKPLKIATVRAKAKRGASSKILRNDGDLADRWLVDVSDKTVEVSNNIKSKGYIYGLVHQYGSKKTPARPFLPIKENGDLEPRLLKTIEDYLDNQIAKAIR